MTKEELIRKAELILEEDKVREFNFHKYVLGSPDALNADALKIHDNLCNFTLELIDLLNKYNVEISSVNGRWDTLVIQEPKGKVAIGVSSLEELKKFSIEELEKRLEESKALIESRKESQNNEDKNEEGYDNEEEFEVGECEMYDYDATGSFIADIEVNVGKIESNDVDEDLVNTCYVKVYDIFGADGVAIDSDEDELFERIKIKELEDGTTLVTINEVECSVRVDIQASCLDDANDERWSAFSKKIRPLKYLKNIREEYVSEAD